MANDHSVVVVIPAELLDAANKLWTAQGLAPAGKPSFTLGLSPTGQGPPTHYAQHSYENSGTASDWLSLGSNGGTVPPLKTTLAAAGLTAQQAKQAAASAVVSATTGSKTAAENLTDVLATMGLKRISTTGLP